MSTSTTSAARSAASTRSRAWPVTDRGQTATRLLASSAKKSYDPAVDVDWAAEVPDDLYGLSPEWSSLYGTSLWDRMTHQQRVTLTKHEVASISGAGIWFEMILMQMLVRDMYGRDATEPHFQFALTEIADECRHSVMFARGAAAFGCPSYRPQRLVLELGRGFAATATGAVAYGGTLFVEELLDVMQRDFMKDERVQPISRTISKIHVLEEARHIRFAREEIVRRVQDITPLQRARVRAVLAATALTVVESLVHPDVYAAAGLDVREARRAVRNNQHYHAQLRHGASRTLSFLDDVGLVGGPSRVLLQRAHLV
ncbi:diiron oxygenase [Rhodococcus sp. X156]|uniref:AurF N-oxygenase family protein n=1 Tax=Rhodococcus sp. X156 TaxID=2499145 RepID=UPI000FDAE1F1|nr:diiron oxygenase [Rhodococcus sp. X156]